MIIPLIFIIFLFILLIIPHELGHFLLAKKFGMQVDRFSFGLGPRLWRFKKGKTEYSISLIPFGGYVKIAGMEPQDRGTENDFHKYPLWKRIFVISAGSIMNYLVSIILFSLIFIIGFYTFNLNKTIIGEVSKGSPAARANLLPDDEILKINEYKVKEWEDIAFYIKNVPEEFLKLEVQREGRIFSVQVKPEFDSQLNKKIIGIIPGKLFVRYNPIVAISKGVERAFLLTKFILLSLGRMIMGKISAEIAGPVGIARFVGESASMGIVPFLSLAALLSVNLGLLNLFPIPALDGGRLLFLLLEGIRGKAFNIEKEEFVHYIGFIVLIFLMLLVTYQDILRWAGGG
ncbi:MAG: RIP metalloprotease RseP [Candidatus Aerophobetes bacterium]|nr:RIP metalloprotease RseP [Candidatus Aerophobetes bacterium]